ncbi:MAG: hypothetical protein IKB71_05260 [Lentisphaeria bacterium]|nr:hypothetical protein [Lentisphaeria bacterium]
MKYLQIIIPALSLLLAVNAEAETPGMTAYREQNYGAAARLLPQELLRLQPGTDAYFEHESACIESLLLSSRIDEAADRITKINSKIPEKYQNRFRLLNAKLAYVQKNFTLCQKLLDEFNAQKKLTANMRYDAILLQCELFLNSNQAAKAVSLLEKTLADNTVAKDGEFTLSLLFMRALAADSKLNRIPAEFEKLKAKYPDRQGKLQHFELLIHAINQDLKKYHELFIKIFPSERPMYTFAGDVVLYHGALLAEQQAQNEKNNQEIAFHLKNQTVFAPNDELRAESWKNLIQLHIRENHLTFALNEVRSLLKNIPQLQDRIKWEMLCADLQSSLKEGDSGLKIYLAVKNNSNADAQSRADAAEKAAAIYKLQNNKTEVLKLYAFLTELPGQPAINDRGVLLCGKFYFENKQYRMGESLLLKIPPASAQYPETLLYLIQCRIANGEYEAAAADIQKLALLKDDGNYAALPDFSAAAGYFQALLLETIGKAEEAAAVYEKTARAGFNKPSSEPLLINSWLKAAELQFKRQSYSNAGLLFLSFAEHYPRQKSAVDALYKSVYCYFLAGRYDEMKYSIDKLCKNYPANELTVNALFHEVDYLHQNDRMQDALKILDLIENINLKNKSAAVASRAIYDRALILYHLQHDREALQILEQLQKYPQQPIAAEGIFLSATIFQEQGDNLKAAEFFKKASQMRADLLFVQICLGRQADNLFLSGTKNKNDDLLKQAAQIYSQQVKNSAIDKSFRLQSLYKWGRTLESLKDWQGALDAYTEALYMLEPSGDSAAGSIIPVWINKSAVNAINIHLRQGGANSFKEALFIIRRLKKLNTMPANELENLESSVRSRYMNNG